MSTGLKLNHLTHGGKGRNDFAPIINLIAIAILGAVLFVTIDKYEPNYLAGRLLKLFVLTFILAMLHQMLLVFDVEFSWHRSPAPGPER